MVVVLLGEELCPGLVRGCPLSLRQSRRRQRLEKRIDHVGRMDPPPPGPWGQREQLVSRKDIKTLWKRMAE